MIKQGEYIILTKDILTTKGEVVKDTPYKILRYNEHHIWINVPSMGSTKLRNITSRMRPLTVIEKIIYDD